MNACEDDAITRASGESPEVVMIAVNESVDIFLSSQSSPLDMKGLSQEIDRILGDGSSYSFVIQSEIDGAVFAE